MKNLFIAAAIGLVVLILNWVFLGLTYNLFSLSSEGNLIAFSSMFLSFEIAFFGMLILLKLKKDK